MHPSLQSRQDSANSEWEARLRVDSPASPLGSVDVDLALELEMSKLQLKESKTAQEVVSRRLAEYINVVQQAKERVFQAEHERRAMGLLVQGWKAREEAAETEKARLARRLQEVEAEKNFMMGELARLKEGRLTGTERDGLD